MYKAVSNDFVDFFGFAPNYAKKVIRYELNFIYFIIVIKTTTSQRVIQ